MCALIDYFHCLRRRILQMNQLSGTIPPELGSLSELMRLYALNNKILFDDTSYELVTIFMILLES